MLEFFITLALLVSVMETATILIIALFVTTLVIIVQHKCYDAFVSDPTLVRLVDYGVISSTNT
jgi:hypothetical protein